MRLFKKPKPFYFKKEITGLVEGQFLLKIDFYEREPGRYGYTPVFLDGRKYYSIQLHISWHDTLEEAQEASEKWDIEFAEWCNYINGLKELTVWYS